MGNQTLSNIMKPISRYPYLFMHERRNKEVRNLITKQRLGGRQGNRGQFILALVAFTKYVRDEEMHISDLGLIIQQPRAKVPEHNEIVFHGK